MPLSLTTPQALGSANTYVIRNFIGDGIDGIGTPGLTISYDRFDGSGNRIDTQYVTITFAAFLAATGANFKAKLYNALQTALGAGSAGTVS